MSMKRMLLLLVCLALWPAAAWAQTVGIANQVPILYISDATGPADALMDDFEGTAWQGQISTDADAPTWTILAPSQTVKEIWIRNGAHSDPQSYLAYGRPSRIAVTVYFENQQVVTYRYRLSDAYTAEDDRNWVDGYQRLLLPGALDGVFCIELRVQSVTPGSASADVALTDIILSAGQASPAGSGIQMRASAPTVRPEPAQPATPTQAPAAQPPAASTPTLPPSSGETVGLTATLLKEIATRTGPGVGYDYEETFLGAGYQVQVISKVWDGENELYWYQVDLYTPRGNHYRGYCVHELRVDIDPSLIPTEQAGTPATVLERTGSFYGPGSDYVAHNDQVQANTKGNIFRWENGYVLFEWRDTNRGIKRRAWIPESVVTWDGK